MFRRAKDWNWRKCAQVMTIVGKMTVFARLCYGQTLVLAQRVNRHTFVNHAYRDLRHPIPWHSTKPCRMHVGALESLGDGAKKPIRGEVIHAVACRCPCQRMAGRQAQQRASIVRSCSPVCCRRPDSLPLQHTHPPSGRIPQSLTLVDHRRPLQW